MYPTSVSSAWRDIIYKADDNYYMEATSANGGRAAVGGNSIGGDLYSPAALTANTWSHLATTYDGATLRFYVNGVQVASRAQTGTLTASANPLQFGGDSLYGDYFQGMIDEVRVYNRALNLAELQTDMNTSIQRPAPPTNLRILVP